MHPSVPAYFTRLVTVHGPIAANADNTAFQCSFAAVCPPFAGCLYGDASEDGSISRGILMVRKWSAGITKGYLRAVALAVKTWRPVHVFPWYASTLVDQQHPDDRFPSLPGKRRSRCL
ncbi:hypothetical protein VKT23_015070 [Stygiomarasmius scandens]|uniref:Uncharacterized protein n=1 Tax=Marasmiellus scandens TaxID=2682957 RepID=A0ABR1J326_9AGAR